MKNINKHITISIITLMLATGAIFSQSADEEKEKAKKPMPYDKGVSIVDVSAYPKEYQDYYKVFQDKCSQCHTLARPINAPYKDEDWSRYVKRMMRKPGSNISSEEGKKIYLFLKYYSAKK